MEERAFSDISYNQYLNEEKLMGSKCKKCGTLFTPPRRYCVKCRNSFDMEWVEMSGKAKLAGFTCIAVGPPFMIEEGYDRNHHYCTGIVELEEGTRVDGRIEGIDPHKPETIKVGTPLKAKYLHRGEGEKMITYLAFEPA